jgi:hypothetical protein
MWVQKYSFPYWKISKNRDEHAKLIEDCDRIVSVGNLSGDWWGTETGKSTICREQNKFLVFLNVEKCKD